MATTFFIRTTKKSGFSNLIARVQLPEYGIDIKQTTRLSVDIERWNKARESNVALSNYVRTNPDIFSKKDAISKMLDTIGKDITPEIMAEEIYKIIFHDQITEVKLKKEAQSKALAEANRMTLTKYLSQYVEGISNGERLNGDKPFGERTVINMRQLQRVFNDFQQSQGKEIDFKDIDKGFYTSFVKFLSPYKQNTIGGHLKNIKAILRAAEEDGYNQFSQYRNKSFKANFNTPDEVYLTEEEVNSIRNLDLSGMPERYDKTRDLFLIGIWCGQRVSDYNGISKIDFHEESFLQVDEATMTVNKREITVLHIRQKKTDNSVYIPVSSEIRPILEKYDYQPPRLTEQVFNRDIKTLCEKAGITQMVQFVEVVGGKKIERELPKYQMVSSHTARRTFCTLAYLSGMLPIDIRKISGHSSEKMLCKYIKAKELECARKIVTQYDYFK